jgi:hypothetical protein
MQDQPTPGFVELVISEQAPEPRQVRGELDAVPEFAYLPQPLKPVRRVAGISEQLPDDGYRATAPCEHPQEPGRIVPAGPEVIHISQHVLAEAPGQDAFPPAAGYTKLSSHACQPSAAGGGRAEADVDRPALFSALLAFIPRSRHGALHSFVTPGTILRWHRDIVRRRWVCGWPAMRSRPLAAVSASELI